VQKAETERKRTADLTGVKPSFEDKRKAQMAAWRDGRVGSAFRQ
jgi:hypothetical protein